MRTCIYLLCLVAIYAHSADLQAHDDSSLVVEGVPWHQHQYFFRRITHIRLLYRAFGPRKIRGIRDRHIDLYDDNRGRMTAKGYDKVLVTYHVSDDMRRRHNTPIPVGIAHLFSEHRRHEVAIEHFDRSHSRVIEVGDISGVLLASHSKSYHGSVTFDERVLPTLSAEWQQRFPTRRGQYYRFRGSVAAAFSDGYRLVEVGSVRYRRNGPWVILRDHTTGKFPIAFMHSDYLERLIPRRVPRS